ncbi:MAG: APC family permease [Candidatus Bathyarchaeia archaeon]
MPSSDETEERSELFLRRASGLIRVAGPWSGLAFNVIWTGNCVGLLAAWILNAYVFISPGYNIPLLIIAAAILSTLNTATYMFFSMAIPRSGGDYHFISRTLHPSLGFMSSVNWALWLPLVLGWLGANVPLIALQSLLTAWGAVTNNPALIELANALLNPDTMFLIGAIVIIVFTAIIILGTKTYFVIQNISFAFMLAAIAITFGAFILKDPNSFAASINRLMGPNTYESMIESFETQFVSIERPPLMAILSGITLWAGINTWACGTSLMAGEIKEERKLRTWLIANVLGSFFVGGIMALTAHLYFTSVGEKFIYAASYLEGSPDYKLLVPPYYSSFVPIALPNVILFVIFAIGFFLGLGPIVLSQNQILASRIMLAWSFDRLMPRRLGHVDKKFHAPVVAILICGIISLIALWMYVYTDWLGLFSQLFAVAFSFFLTAISAIVFPFRRKEMFESSPARFRVGGIPVMSLVGLANAIFLIVFMYQNWIDDMLGSNHPVSITLILSILAISFILYWIIRAIRRRQGIDIDALFREIPPE